ncbi:hypothetical protein [Streptomyces sp. Wb2n-11]|uniref:hypothetical protein n=1 Tax=Streptomyces sp. Wb2n-11 TaxID=1030533 RepID=UPI000AAE1F3C|nr:hypothetical protein [Streptomyces sp. Wb2n-11]
MTATVPRGPRPRGPGPEGPRRARPGAAGSGSRFADDVLPVPVERRRRTAYDFAAPRAGMAHSVPSRLLASGPVAPGVGRKRAAPAGRARTADGERGGADLSPR